MFKSIRVLIKENLSYRRITYFLLSLILINAIGFYISLPDVKYLETKNPPTTALMEMRKEQALEAGKKYRVRQQWVGFKQIPDLLKKAIRITEDSNFYTHGGVDWEEMEESFKKNWEKGEFARGGSTISQQLVKNLFLTTEKSIFRKIKELFITLKLENDVSKNRIFHIYLNVIEFGNGIFGVQQASRYYFNKDVSALSLPEIVRLTAVIPKPLSVRANGNSGWLKWKSRWILGKLKLYKYISEEDYNSAIVEFQK